MTDGNPVPYAPLSCPQCNGEWGMFEHLDFDRDTIGYGCRKCGITERDKHGAICRVMGVRIARPPGVSVEAFNRQIRAIEATVRENCQGFKETWEKAKR